MRTWAGLVLALACSAVLGACSGGSTEVSGAGGEEASGATAGTAPTDATAPTGATGATSVTGFGGELAGAVSLDIPPGKNPTGAAMYSCDGVEGTWTYDPGQLPVEGVEFTVEAAPFDMAGGDGTLVIEGTVVIPNVGEAGFLDTVKLEIRGSADAPTMASTGVKVEATGAIQSFPFDFAQFFPEGASFPIVPGAPQC